MLRSIKDITTYPIQATDGPIGKSKDALFDDRFWTLRYLMADTKKWLMGRKVLISTMHLNKPEVGFENNRFHVDLTKQQVEDAPPLSDAAPISTQYETEFANYYNQDLYWMNANFMMDPGLTPRADQAAEMEEEIRHTNKLREIRSSHLRSANEVMGYHINAQDDEFGHVEDFIIEDETWVLKFVVIDSRNWLPGKKFLVDINWLQDISWSTHFATVNLSRKQIKRSPEYKPHIPINSDYLNNLYDYYGLPYPSKPTVPAVTPK